MEIKDIRIIFEQCKTDFVKDSSDPNISHVLDGINLSSEDVKELEKIVEKDAMPGSPAFQQCIRTACRTYILANLKQVDPIYACDGVSDEVPPIYDPTPGSD